MRRALPVLLALLIGVLLGRLISPSPQGDPLPGHTSPGAGEGVANLHSRAGAIAAAGTYQQAFADPAILAPGGLRRRVRELAIPSYVAEMMRANRAGVARLSRGALGRGLREGIPTAYLGVPVSYRLLSYTPRRAVVEIWGFTVLGNATSAEPSAYFGLARTTLVWSGGRWKIASTRASFGPTPRLATPRRGGEGFSLVDVTQRMRSYDIAP